VTFKALQRVEGGNEKRGKNQISIFIEKPQVKRFTLKIRSRHLLDVLGNAIESGVIFTDERTPGVVDEAAELARANVIDPFHRCARISDDIFSICLVEKSVAHGVLTKPYSNQGLPTWTETCTSLMFGGGIGITVPRIGLPSISS